MDNFSWLAAYVQQVNKLVQPHYLFRQLRGMPGARLSVGYSADPRLAAHGLKPSTRIQRIADQAVAITLPGPSGNLGWIASRRLSESLAAADVFYSMFLRNILDPWATMSRYGLSEVRTVCSIPSPSGDFFRSVDKAKSPYLASFRSLDAVLYGSHYVSTLFEDFEASGTERHVHYLGVDLPPGDIVDRAVKARSRRRSTSRFIAVSRLDPIKGIDRTIEAFKITCYANPDAILDIIGDGPERKRLQEQIDALGLESRVRLRGWVSLEDVYIAMLSADVFVQHNVRLADGQEEALGGSILEAEAAALPVVVADSGGTSEAMIAGETGFLVDSGDVDDMADKMSRLSSDRDQAQVMGMAGRRFVSNFHEARQQDAKLRRLLQNRRRSAL